jgi:hypothetical protein
VFGGSGAGRIVAGVARSGLQSWWHAPGPGGGGMTLEKRHSRRLSLAARSGLRRLLGCKDFPQLLQEGWFSAPMI